MRKRQSQKPLKKVICYCFNIVLILPQYHNTGKILYYKIKRTFPFKFTPFPIQSFHRSLFPSHIVRISLFVSFSFSVPFSLCLYLYLFLSLFLSVSLSLYLSLSLCSSLSLPSPSLSIPAYFISLTLALLFAHSALVFFCSLPEFFSSTHSLKRSEDERYLLGLPPFPIKFVFLILP